MYYRRKVVLSILQVFENELEKIQVQKLLFLLSKYKTKKKTYDFVPYKFGSFSFQANADLNILKKYGIIEETNTTWKKVNDENYLVQLDKEHQKIVSDFKIIYKNKSSDDLIKLTYKNFPYYAINSTVAHRYLNKSELKHIEEKRPSDHKTVLFTIGYEGISLESYLNKLIRNNVALLCDVRKNAASMKYGFSKRQLENACNGVGIKYLHIPEVGIDSDKRQKLETQADYEALFKNYVADNLTKTVSSQLEIFDLLKQHKRIALTCFEADKCQCHRLHLAKAIEKLEDFTFEVEHL